MYGSNRRSDCSITQIHNNKNTENRLKIKYWMEIKLRISLIRHQRVFSNILSIFFCRTYEQMFKRMKHKWFLSSSIQAIYDSRGIKKKKQRIKYYAIVVTCHSEVKYNLALESISITIMQVTALDYMETIFSAIVLSLGCLRSRFDYGIGLAIQTLRVSEKEKANEP